MIYALNTIGFVEFFVCQFGYQALWGTIHNWCHSTMFHHYPRNCPSDIYNSCVPTRKIEISVLFQRLSPLVGPSSVIVMT